MINLTRNALGQCLERLIRVKIDIAAMIFWPYPPTQGPKAICTHVGKMAHRGGEETFLGLFDRGAQCTVILQPVGDVSAGVKFTLGRYRGIMVDGIRYKSGWKMGFWNRFCVRSHVFHLNVLLGWILCLGIAPPPKIVKQRSCKPTLMLDLIGHAQWEPLEVSRPTQVANWKQYRNLPYSWPAWPV